jgi:hypothetical protein
MAQRAVLVGINYYGTEQALSGCINDVQRVADVLRTLYGFPNQNIIILTDNLPKTSPLYPTKANIMREIATLRASTKPGDIAMFHYSGHGIKLRNTTSTNLDHAGIDNALIPTDVFNTRGSYVAGNEIVDDELWAWASGFPDGSFLFSIVDACHSGSALDLPYALKAPKNKSGTFSVARVETRSDTLAKVIMLSGCNDDQTSLDTVDSKRQPVGALTYAFCDYLLHNPSRAVNYFDFLTSVRAHIVSRNKSVPNIQEPQLAFGRIADTNTLFTLTAPSKTRAVSFDDTLLRSLIATLENPPPTPAPAPAPVPTPAPTPAPAPARPLIRQQSRPAGSGLHAALLARRR